MPRVDAHAHLIPEGYRAALERRSLVPYPLPPWSRDTMIEFMGRHDIEAAVVSLSPPGVSLGGRALNRELARLANDAIAELVTTDPDRFAGLAVLPLPDIDDALEETRRAFDELHLDGVAILSNADGIYPGDPAWDPLFDELEARGAYVFLHPTAPPHTAPLDGYPAWLHEFPFETTRALIHLIYSGTLERCPRIRLQVAHMGGTAPFIAHRLASLAARESNLCELAPAGALAHLERVYYDTALSANAPALAATAAITSLDHVVYGSDWPYADLPDSGDPAPGLSALTLAERARLDATNIGALVPRLARP